MTPQVYTVPTAGPALEREMAAENQVELLFGRSASRWREDPHPSTILRTRSTGGQRLGELYDEMEEKDADLAGFLAKRREAVLELPRRIEPRDSSPAAVEAADLCRAALEPITGFADVLSHQLGARPRGVAFTEIVWHQPTTGPLAGAWVPGDLVDRPMWRFLFRDKALHVRRGGAEPLLAPPGKFLHWASGTKDSPWGKPLLDKAYWFWWIKKHGWKFWAVFVEKWAQPTAVGKYPWKNRGATPGEVETKADQDLQGKLLAVLRALQSEMAVAIPEGLELDLLEASRSGSISYESFIQACSRGEALLILGEVNTSGLRPGTGAFASEKISHEISRQKVRLDAHDLGAHLTDQLLAPIVHLNLGVDVPVPRFTIDIGEAEDRQQRMEGVDKVLAAGEPVGRRYFFATHLVPEPTEGEEVIRRERPSAAPPPPPSPEPADTPPQPPADPSQRPEPGGQARARQLVARLQASGDLAELERQAEERDAATAEVAAAFRAAFTGYYTRQRELLEEAWQSGAAARGEAMRYVTERLDARELGEVILAAQAHGLGLSFAHLIDDGLGEALWATAPAARLDLPLQEAGLRHRWGTGALLQAPAGFDAATTWATAIEFWSRLLAIAKSLFLGLEDDQRRLAFTAAGLEEVAILRDAHGVVREGIAEGWSLQEFRRRLAEVYETHGVTPTSDWHADLILNNNLRQASAAVRWAQTVGNPEVHRLIPYLAWHTLGDDRVRDRPEHNHRAMSERIFATGHEIWRTWWYPAGHNCRCYVGTITAARARRLGLVGAEPTGPWPIDRHSGGRALPDPGFRSAPNVAATVDTELLPRIERHVAEIEAQRGRPGGNDLADAIRRLLGALIGLVFGGGGA